MILALYFGDSMEFDAKMLGCPSVFDGSEAAWSDWSFQTRAYLETLSEDVATALELLSRQVGEVVFQKLSAQMQAASRKVFYVLIRLLRGPALLELKRVEQWVGMLEAAAVTL